jgi:hypothetical protein
VHELAPVSVSFVLHSMQDRGYAALRRVASDYASFSQPTIQGTPKRSSSIPKAAAQNDLSIGVTMGLSSPSAANARLASATVAYLAIG